MSQNSETQLDNNGNTESEENVDIVEDFPIIPISGDLVVFPHMPPIPPFSPHHIALSGAMVAAAVEDAMVSGPRSLCIFHHSEDKDTDNLAKDDLSPFGSLVQIVKYKKDGENVLFLAQGRSRVKIEEITQKTPFMKARVTIIEEEEYELDDQSEALLRSIVDLFTQIVETSPHYQEEFAVIVQNIDSPGRLTDYVASVVSLKTQDRQKVLAAINVLERMETLLPILTKELNVVELETKIQSDAQAEISDLQREHFLREQMRAIQKELGDSEDISVEIEEMRQKLVEINMPEKAQKAAEREIKRLSQMQSFSPEATVCRNYLDWSLNLPWDKSTEDSLDIGKAQKILDEDHYNLIKVKDRILEFLAVRLLNPEAKGPILCFVGPPGVGKTSLGKSIARSMGRKFVRISLGGIRDEAEIHGHRRTYIGSMPGRIIKGLRQAESNNPIFMLDEIDKLGSDFRGDPSSALLEVLDPEQNNSFVDNYLDVDFDLSKVMFIATANQMHTVPPALCDRMETLELLGYTTNEKAMIAKQYLIPRQLDQNGLTKANLTFRKSGILSVIESYTRESGLRNLERELGTICRKVARSIAQGEERKTIVTAKKIDQYLGPVEFHPEIAERNGEIGVATGLSVTPHGGEILFIEATVTRGEGKLMLTGQIGDVMQESAKAAMSCVSSKSKELNFDPNFFKEHDFHIHVPAGAIPKDGPSAGITIATVLVSLATKREISPDVAMTGEISLRGRVLPIGGLKEKVLAAKQAGIKMIIAPEKNQKDLIEIPDDAKEGLDFVFVNQIDQVFKKAL